MIAAIGARTGHRNLGYPQCRGISGRVV